MSQFITINSRVKEGAIRKETYNGKEHFVVQSYTLPFDVVMNGGLYPAQEIGEHYQSLEGTLAPLGHPEVNGEFVSAFSPEGLNDYYCGAWNRNVKKVDGRISVEKWVDIEVAQRTEQGKRLLARLEGIVDGSDTSPIGTSVGVYLKRVAVTNKDAGYDWIADIESIDHDAILLDEAPAASTDQGVGMAVNAEDAQPVKVQGGLLREKSYGQRQADMQKAINAKFGDNFYVGDMTNEQVIVEGIDGSTLYEYTVDDDQILINDSGEAVERKESWYSINRLMSLFKSNGSNTLNANEDVADMALTPEEKQELLDGVAAMVEPITQAVEELKANQATLSEQVSSIGAAEDEAMREVVANKFGAEVAKELSGNALKLMFDKCGKPTEINTNGKLSDDDLAHFDEVPA